MKRLAVVQLAVALIGLGFFWWLMQPVYIRDIADTEITFVDGNAAQGEQIFWASGCASCHAEKGAEGDKKLLLGGGHRIETPFGTFITPNISPDSDTGIGNWSAVRFYDSLVYGTSYTEGHYYPSFPYASYSKMKQRDILDLFAFIKTLPAVAHENEPHELPWMLQWRRPLGIWKRLFTDDDWVIGIDKADAKLQRGRYLVEALGHCGECHTPRNLLGGLQKSQWLAGGPAPEGEGRTPNITPHEDGIGSWSEGDIAYYLESGFTPDFDSVGGTMTSVQQNMAKLPKSDLEAIATYLKAIPPVASN